MTIQNTAPLTMIIQPTFAVGYSTVYLNHSGFTDQDVVGKVFWVDDTTTTDPDVQILDNTLTNFYSIIPNLQPNRDYNLIGAYYDRMLDTELLDARLGINISTTSNFTTASAPTIVSVDVTSVQADVGTGFPQLQFSLAGDATRLVIEQKSTAAGSVWETIYSGGFQSEVLLGATVGSYTYRVRGTILLPDGETADVSAYSTETGTVLVTYAFAPPVAPSTISTTVFRLQDGIEKFDVEVSWAWAQGAGSNIREFYLQYVTQAEFTANGWTNANVINSGTSDTVIIPNFPVNIEHRFRVAAVAWGPTDANTTFSTSSTFTLDAAEVAGATLVSAPNTALDVHYSGITAYNIVDNVRTQTFRIDAATGNVAMGRLNAQNIAPVSVDGITGDVNISGRTITQEIVAASVVLANLTGEDNPAIRTSTKTEYAQATEGFWMGFDESDSQFKFDVGDASKFIRWDGDNLIISGTVQVGTAGGNVNIGDGLGVRTRGIYAQAISDFTVFDAAEAAQFFTANFNSAPVNDDVLTQFNTATPTVAETRRWNGTAWIAASLVVHGDAIIDGTLVADKIVADDAFLQTIGVNTIYDNAAVTSGDPEANFTMKIDLAAGSIFIR